MSTYICLLQKVHGRPPMGSKGGYNDRRLEKLTVHLSLFVSCFFWVSLMRLDFDQKTTVHLAAMTVSPHIRPQQEQNRPARYCTVYVFIFCDCDERFNESKAQLRHDTNN